MSTFLKQNKLGLDKCAITAKQQQNDAITKYSLWNTAKCDDKELEDLTTNNLNLRYKNGYGYTNGCMVDTDTELRINGKWTSEKAKTQLFSRFYTASPNLAKGAPIPAVEAKLVQGDDTHRLTQCKRLTEKDFDRFVPMIPCLGDNIQKAENIVMPFHQNGTNSRQYMRDRQPRYNNCFGHDSMK